VIHFKKATGSKKSKSSKKSTPIEIAVGDFVSLNDPKHTCLVEKIRVLATGKNISKFSGAKEEIVITFQNQDYEQNIWLSELDFEKLN